MQELSYTETAAMTLSLRCSTTTSIYGGGGSALIETTGSHETIFGEAGNDVVMNFHDGDILQIEKNINGLHVTSAADLVSHVHDDGGNAVITLGSETITLIGVKADDIHHNPSGYFTVH